MYYVWNSAVEELPFDPDWSSTGYIVKKYGGQRNVVAGAFSGNNQGNFNNERIYRFAEMKLLYAEALLQKEGPQKLPLKSMIFETAQDLLTLPEQQHLQIFSMKRGLNYVLNLTAGLTSPGGNWRLDFWS